ncbi:hypothetical protein M8J77_003129 [Diaphorina citri]|nr:hypothetical protein M8J77_003129 [Diaphorina citri]
MSEYQAVKRGKLVLKGEKPAKKKKKNKSDTQAHGSNSKQVDPDIENYAGWTQVKHIKDIVGAISIEFGKRTFVSALDNGLFILGAIHEDKEGPSPEEIFTAILVNDSKVAFKSGFDKYLSIDKNGRVTGRSDAVGPLEQWEPVFEDDNMALLGANQCFMSVSERDDSIVATSRKAGKNEMVKLRSNSLHLKNLDKDDDIPEEERTNKLSDIELNYVKKFQKFQDKKIKLNSDNIAVLKEAKAQGYLHETMLDRRSKMKADRYCK